MSGQTFSSNLRKIERELKIVNAKANQIRKEKRYLQTSLYQYMLRHDLYEVEGYTREKLEPRKPIDKPPKKPEKQIYYDTVEHLRQLGIVNPGALYRELDELRK